MRLSDQYRHNGDYQANRVKAQIHWIGSETSEHRSLLRRVEQASLSRTMALDCGHGYEHEDHDCRRKVNRIKPAAGLNTDHRKRLTSRYSAGSRSRIADCCCHLRIWLSISTATVEILPTWPSAVYFTTPELPVNRDHPSLSHRERKCAENYNKRQNKFILKSAISILLISNHNSFRVLFHKIASVCFIWKVHLCFSIGNGQPR